MITRKCKLKDADEILVEELENIFVEYYEIDVPDCKDTISIYGYRIIVPEAGFSIRGGTYNNWDEDEGMALPDFALSLIYDLDETDPAQYLYWEQDDELISLYNFLRVLDSSSMYGGVGNMDCQIEFEEEDTGC